MTVRDNIKAILHYEKFDNFPVINFSYWPEVLEKWANEGYLTREEIAGFSEYDGDPEADGILDVRMVTTNNSRAEDIVNKKLGFDCDWGSGYKFRDLLYPAFAQEVIEKKEDGSQIMRNEDGALILMKPGVSTLATTLSTGLTGRDAWEKLYLPKLQWNRERVDWDFLKTLVSDEGREIPYGLHVGSFMGRIRDILGVEQLSYLYADDEDLFAEIVETVGALICRNVEEILKTGAKFDYVYIWEDLCFKNGPLVVPSVFDELVGPQYKTFTDMVKRYGIDIISVDCDGKIDSLIPTWIENGVNTMFPMEIGTWNASILPWREKYGKELLGIGGMNKQLFSRDYKAIDDEIERLKPLIELGGYIPCPDHGVLPDAKFEVVQYYCDRMHNLKL